MPEKLRKIMLKAFSKLPYRVLWKYETKFPQNDLPNNIKISRWLPQQDILGHKKLKAFITHGGLLSMYETVYHGVPAVVMPIFCDHDANSEKSKADEYGNRKLIFNVTKYVLYLFFLSICLAFKLHLETLTSENLFKAIHAVIHDPKYRNAAK